MRPRWSCRRCGGDDRAPVVKWMRPRVEVAAACAGRRGWPPVRWRRRGGSGQMEAAARGGGGGQSLFDAGRSGGCDLEFFFSLLDAYLV